MQGKWEVPLPKVKGVSEAEVFRVVRTGKTKSEYCSVLLHLSLGSVQIVMTSGKPKWKETMGMQLKGSPSVTRLNKIWVQSPSRSGNLNISLLSPSLGRNKRLIRALPSVFVYLRSGRVVCSLPKPCCLLQRLREQFW